MQTGLTLREKILELMEAKNLSIAELERLAGLSIHSVRNILKGRVKKPSAQAIQAIADALECPVEYLMSSTSAAEAGFPQDLNRKTKKPRPLLEHPELMIECLDKILKELTAKGADISIDEYFDVVKKVYLYSSREEPRDIDMRFTAWLFENQLGIVLENPSKAREENTRATVNAA